MHSVFTNIYIFANILMDYTMKQAGDFLIQRCGPISENKTERKSVMGRWKDRWKRSLVLLLTAALVGHSARYAMLSVSAKEISAEETAGQDVQETETAEEQAADALPEVQKEDTGTITVQEAGTVTAEAANAAVSAPDSENEEEPDAPDKADETEQPVSEESETEESLNPAEPETAVPEDGAADQEEPEAEEASNPEKPETAVPEDEAVEKVIEQLAALPSLDEVKSQTEEEQKNSYDQVQEAYDAYESLTEEQRAQIEEAEGIFAPLFEYFNGLIMPLEEEVTEERIIEELVDLGDTCTSAENGISLFSVDNGYVDLAEGDHVNWIDRVSLPDYARTFYDTLVEAANNDGSNDWLISDASFSENDAITYNNGVSKLKGIEVLEVTRLTEMPNNEWNYIQASMRAAYDAFDRDHPEIFWLSGGTKAMLTGVKRTSGNDISYVYKIYFVLKTYNGANGNFDIRETNFQNENMIKTAIAERDKNVQTILAAVSTGNVVDQIKTLNDWLTKHNEYNTNLSDAQNNYPAAWECISALAGKGGTEGPVCEGYARAFKVLCDKLQIPCVLVDGHAKADPYSDGEAHMWNFVQVDGAWYAVDVTWNDPVVSGVTGVLSGHESEKWLLLGAGSVVDDSWFAFIDSHPIENQASEGGVQFMNGPMISESKYEAKDPAVVLFTSTVKSVEYTGTAPTISELSVKVKGQEVTNPTITYFYRVNGSDSEFIKGLPVDAGKYEVKAHVAAGAGYGSAESDNTLVLTITKASVQIAINDAYTGKVYDGVAMAVPSEEQMTITGTQYGKVRFEWYKGDQKQSSAPTDAGSYVVKAFIDGTDNYSAGNVEKEIVITQRPLTITAKNQTIAYKMQILTGANQADCSNLVTGHTLRSIVLTASTTVATENGTITPSAATIKSAETDVTSNYQITYRPGKLVITKPNISKAEVMLSAGSYKYDGTYKKPTVISVKVNDKVLEEDTDYTVSYENNKDAGTAKVKVTALANGNYIGEVTKEFTINRKPVTVTATAADKVYDGTTGAVVTGTIDGLASGDNVTVNLTGTFADKNAGTGKSVSVSGTVSGDASKNYRVTIPAGATASITPKPITVTAANVISKTYGAPDPELTYTVEGLISGDSLTGSLTRDEGEDVIDGLYNITQGTLTAGSNYTIHFIEGGLAINPANCTPSVVSPQNILTGLGSFIEPTFKGVKGEKVEGTLTYTYGNTSGMDYEALKTALAGLPLGTEGEITYSFAADSSNYSGEPVTGTISFTIKDVLFEAGGETATANNAVTIKSSPVYGVSWSDIVKLESITAVAGEAKDTDASHFTLKETGIPNAGVQTFTVVYNGTLNGKTYTDTTVCTGTLEFAKRPITVSAGSGNVSKTYDGTTTAGILSGSVNVTGILGKDTGVTVQVVPAAYTSPDVGGQANVQASLAVNGDTDGNYELSGASVTLPCEILPKPITPSAAFTGAGPYTYTGEAVTPGLEVKDGNVLLKSTDYTLTWSDHIHAGTAKVAIHAKAGGNYTWTTPAELTFTIEKADYTGAKSANQSTRYGREGTFDLAGFLPEGYRLGAIQVEDNDQIFRTAPAVKGEAVVYTLVSSPELKGKQAVVTVPVTDARDYKPFEFKLTITLSDKMEQAGFGFDAEKLDKVYGDVDFVISAVNAAVESCITYTSSDPSVASVDGNGKVRILKIGTAVITAEASETEDYMSASASYTLNIAPKALVWDVSGLSAADKDGTVTDRKASLYGELRVSGILKGDDAAFVCPADQLTGTYHAATPGEQKVTLAWAGTPVALLGAKSGNYTMPQTLPEITGKINAVSGGLPTPPESTKEVQYQLEMEKGISGVPESFKGMEELNTPVKIDTQMRLNLQKSSDQIAEADTEVYDIVLMINIAGGGWQEASKENFPSNGLTITLPYPEGTGRRTHDFMVCHLFTENMNGHRAGDTEYPAVTKTADGLRFKVYGLSPISVGWTDAGVLRNPVSGGGGNGHSSGSGSSGSSAPASQQSAVQSAPTADESPIVFYTGMLLLSAAGLACMGACRRRRKIR